MLIVMKTDATGAEIEKVLETVRQMGFKAHPMPGATRTAIGITGNQGAIPAGEIELLAGVAEVLRVTKPYKLVSREIKHEDTVVQVGPAAIGGGELAIIAGPCAVESRDQCLAIAEIVAKTGVRLFRGGAFKPRTSPYAFQGLGEQALEILAEVRERFGLGIVTEVLDHDNVALAEKYVDLLQIGARNMQNFSLLKRVGQSGRPVLLKRGMAATLEELLLAAEYVMAEGNYQVVLCERGVRTFTDHTRNTLDLSIVPAVRKLSHLPIIVDPSHGTGRRDKVLPMARAAVAAGAHGLVVEVHNQPERALSDGPQALLPEMFERMVADVRAIHALVQRQDTESTRL
jgi:3-deoxy-7-phosphoheptulonate synthase